MSAQPLVYVGTYTNSPSKGEGIYLCRFDPATGALNPIGSGPFTENPTFLTLNADGTRLYAVNELDDGAVSAFQVDPTTGGLRFINQVRVEGAAPCHLAIDPTGRWLLTANYSSGSTSVLSLREDGGVGELAQVMLNPGTPGPGQHGGHGHCVRFDRTNGLVFTADLGLDRLIAYRFDAEKGRLTYETAGILPPGAGPRHFVFDRDERFVYVINELGSTLTVFAYEGRARTLTEVQTLSTLPAGFEGSSYCADIHLSDNGNFVYGSNRGHDSLAMFAVDRRTGKLTSLGQEPVRGKWPRNFAIAPGGRYLLVANQNTDNVVTFRFEGLRGRLRTGGRETTLPAPVCLLFAG